MHLAHNISPLLMLLVCLVVAEVAAAGEDVLVTRPDGGWQTNGLPYTAVISPSGALASLTVRGYDFLTGHGLFLGGDAGPAPVTVTVNGDTATIIHPNAHLTVHFLPEQLEFTSFNSGVTDGFPARMEVNKAVARIKNPTTGVDYPLPPATLDGAMRLIAPTGAILTLSGAYLYPQGGVYYMKLPWARTGGPETKFTFDIAPATPLEDQLKVTVKAASEDFTYWSADPQPFYTELTNMLADQPFRGTLTLRLQAYLTKAYVRELRQPVALAKGGTKSLTWTLEKLDPGLYIAEIWVERGKERGLCCRPRVVLHAAGLTPPPLPADFNAFWQRTLEEQAKIPLDLQLSKVKELDKVEVYKFNFAGLLHRRIYGYLTVPKDKTKRYPAILILPSSGEHHINIPNYADAHGNPYACMAINITNLDVDLPEEQYDWRTWPAPYLVTGILDRDYYSLRFSFAGLVRAAEVLSARPEVQPDEMLCMGSSQGGGLTLIAAGLYPKFKAAIANVPGLCRLDWNVNYLNPPYFPIATSSDGRGTVLSTLQYYDPVHFARNITCPIWVSLGLMDDVTPSMGVFCAYNVIPAAQKHLHVMPYIGHGGSLDPATAKGSWP